MLFKRKNKQHIGGKVRDFIWPRSGWRRSSEYIVHRVARLKGSTRSVAVGVACGASVSFTPFLGLHFLLAFVLAFFMRGNFIGAAIGTAIGNPWTFPLIFALTGGIGSEILGDSFTSDLPDWSGADFAEDPWQYFVYFLWFLVPFLVGAVPVAIVVWFFFYFAMKMLLESYQKKRMNRRVALARERLEQAMAAEESKPQSPLSHEEDPDRA